jgi:hypothetical protein
MERTHILGPVSLEALEVQLLDKPGRWRLPGLLIGIDQTAELLRIQPQLPGHLDVGIGKVEAPACLDPG